MLLCFIPVTACRTMVRNFNLTPGYGQTVLTPDALPGQPFPWPNPRGA